MRWPWCGWLPAVAPQDFRGLDDVQVDRWCWGCLAVSLSAGVLAGRLARCGVARRPVGVLQDGVPHHRAGRR